MLSAAENSKFPTALQNKQNQLQNIADKYYNTYKNYQDEIIDYIEKIPELEIQKEH